jgi:hypothetical protein
VGFFGGWGMPGNLENLSIVKFLSKAFVMKIVILSLSHAKRLAQKVRGENYSFLRKIGWDRYYEIFFAMF